MLLRHLLDEGLSKSAIAERLRVGRGVIYHWLATGQLDRDLDAPSPRAAARRPTKQNAYHGIIGERLATWPELSSMRLFGGIARDHRHNKRLDDGTTPLESKQQVNSIKSL